MSCFSLSINIHHEMEKFWSSLHILKFTETTTQSHTEIFVKISYYFFNYSNNII